VKKSILAVLLASSAVLGGPVLTVRAQGAAPGRGIVDLHGGTYEIKLRGLICTACTRAIVEELAKDEAVQEAKADFDNEQVLVKIKLDKTLTASALRKALKRAAKRADLGTKFEVKDVVYRPTL
jgi:copper chaperone CopZ